MRIGGPKLSLVEALLPEDYELEDETPPVLDYIPITPPDEAIVCLRCGLVTVTGAVDVHEAMHDVWAKLEGL